MKTTNTDTNQDSAIMLTPSYFGRLLAFFETGSEGVCWMLERDQVPGEDIESGYDLLINIEPGDQLEVYGDGGSVIWGGRIVPDTTYGWYPYPRNPILGQQSLNSLWVHWVQDCDNPEAWGRMFHDRRQARLVKEPAKASLPAAYNFTHTALKAMSAAEIKRITPSLVHALARYLALPDQDLCGIYHIDAATLDAWRTRPKEAQLSSEAVRHIAGVLEIWALLRNFGGSADERKQWLLRPNPSLNGHTPYERIALGQDADLVKVQEHLRRALQRACDTLGEEVVF